MWLLYNATMIKTQIYIPKTVHKRLTHLAKVRKEPMAKLVRDFIDEGLQREQAQQGSGIEVLQALAEIKARGGPKDLSTNHDYYLYGAPKKKS
jgi:predicted transcriptional regulator